MTAKIDIPKRGTAAFADADNKKKIIEYVCFKIDFNFIPAVRTEHDALRVVDSLIEKSFYMEDKNPMFSPETSHTDSDKTFAEKKFTPDKENWRNSEKQQKLFDAERDMSKTYKGKIDIEKRAIFDTDYLRHVYEDMQERSMQDINKYQFRRSHPTDPGIKTTIAGSEHTAVDDGSSFLDNFSLRDRIQVDVPSASFKGNPTSRSAQRAQKAQKASKVSEVSSEGLIKKSDTVRTRKGKVQSVEYSGIMQ